MASRLGGKKDKYGQVPTISPEAISYLQNLFQQIGPQGQAGQNYNQANDYYSQMLGGNSQSYQNFAAPHMTQFNEQTIPRLAERFAGMGGGLGGGVLGSSGFGQAVGGAANQFQSNLAGLYAQLQQQAAQHSTNQYNQLGQLGLNTQQFQPTYQQGNTGILGGAASGAASGVGQAAGQAGGEALMALIQQWMNGQKDSNKPQKTSSMGNPNGGGGGPPPGTFGPSFAF